MTIAVAMRFYDVYHDKNVDLLDTLLAPTYIGQVNGRDIVGIEAAKSFISAFLAAFPDVRYTIHDTIADGDKVVTLGVQKLDPGQRVRIVQALQF